MDSTVHWFCSKGIAESTRKTYQSALRKFYQFCKQFNIISPFPVSESLLCYFISYLAFVQHLSPKTIKVYLAGIRHMQVVLGLPEPREFSSLPRLRLVQSGIQRTHSQRMDEAVRVRLPITASILAKMRSYWFKEDVQLFDNIMLWAAATLCFHGFFRAGELTVPTVQGYNPSIHLSWGDVEVNSHDHASVVKVRLKRSKMDQLGQGVDVFVGRTRNILCPVEAIGQYVARRGSHSGCFFQFENNSPLTKPKFVAKIREVLEAIGLPYTCFAGHSFRIGAATAAAHAGVEDSVIQLLGRWSSAAFLAYIRTPREELAQYSCLLSRLS